MIAHISQHQSDYIHFLCLVRAILLNNESRTGHEGFETVLLNRRRIDILRLLSGTPPDGIMKLLRKMDASPLDQPDLYLKLLALSEDTDARKTLRHVKVISKSLIICLDNLPSEMRFNKGLVQSPDAFYLDKLDFASSLVKKLYPAGLPASDLQSYRTIENEEQLLKWLSRLFMMLKFPDPPWPGNGEIQHVGNVRELVELQAKYNNCILIFFEEIFSRQKVFYECPACDALIALESEFLGGWYIEAILGINNEDVPEDKKNAILKEFSKLDIHARRTANLKQVIRFSDWSVYLKDL